jgi:hypothetical protein
LGTFQLFGSLFVFGFCDNLSSLDGYSLSMMAAEVEVVLSIVPVFRFALILSTFPFCVASFFLRDRSYLSAARSSPLSNIGIQSLLQVVSGVVLSSASFSATLVTSDPLHWPPPSPSRSIFHCPSPRLWFSSAFSVTSQFGFSSLKTPSGFCGSRLSPSGIAAFSK